MCVISLLHVAFYHVTRVLLHNKGNVSETITDLGCVIIIIRNNDDDNSRESMTITVHINIMSRSTVQCACSLLHITSSLI